MTKQFLKISFLFLFFWGVKSVHPSGKLPEKLTKQIWDHIYANQFDEVKAIVLSEYNTYKNNIALLSFYEIALNGLGDKPKANKVRKKIFKIWKKNHKSHYEKENYPVNLSNYIRVAITTDKHLFLGSEYYTPYPINSKKEGYYYHKIMVYDKSSKKLLGLYKLEKSKYTNEEYVLFKIEPSGTSASVQNYGNTEPDLSDEIEKIKSLPVGE
jgi:hypothetical protein